VKNADHQKGVGALPSENFDREMEVVTFCTGNYYLNIEQGDQIRRTFDYWEIVSFRHFLKISEMAKNFEPHFSTVQVTYQL
jgi:D-mannonate dehydratase